MKLGKDSSGLITYMLFNLKSTSLGKGPTLTYGACCITCKMDPNPDRPEHHPAIENYYPILGLLFLFCPSFLEICTTPYARVRMKHDKWTKKSAAEAMCEIDF